MSSALRLEISTAGWATAVTVTAPERPAPLDAWLPLLQALASQVAQAADAAAAEAGAPVACAKGCGACCRQLVAISPVEARALAKLVAAMPQPRQAEVRARFAAALGRVAQSGIAERDHAQPDPRYPLAESPQQRLAADWFALQIACPFLEDEACSIYEERPLVCREHLVTSPAAHCARLFQEPVERVELPVRLGAALARAAETVAGVTTAMIPLAMSLDLPPAVVAALDRPRDPRATLEAILSEIGEWRIEAAT